MAEQPDAYKLLEELRASDYRSRRAIRGLVTLGRRALPALADALRVADEDRVLLLRGIIASIHDPDAIGLLVELTRDSDINVSTAAFEALGKSGDARAIEPLARELRRTAGAERAIRALGNLRNTAAVPKLLAHAGELLEGAVDTEGVDALVARSADEGPWRLEQLLEVAGALAKLNQHQLAFVPVKLSRHGREHPDDWEAAMVRVKAARTLQYVVGPGVFAALVSALDDPDREIREMALRGGLYLGCKEFVPHLIDHINPDDVELGRLAYSTLRDLVGQWPASEFVEEVRPGELQQWWAMEERRFSSGTVYRLGEPLDVLRLIRLLEDREARVWIRHELEIVTGVEFGESIADSASDGDRLITQASTWWESEGHRFRRGSLYKFGHPQDLGLALTGL
jgi:HEAT repeat protein